LIKDLPFFHAGGQEFEQAIFEDMLQNVNRWRLGQANGGEGGKKEYNSHRPRISCINYEDLR